ncbi:SHOCT domain-containing protein [Arenibacter sp. 6A1]|nr:SHOCT domain-containing protein [Arenibacter sp. 6A1]
MHYIWWIVWLIILVWIFFMPLDIHYKGPKAEDPLDILKKRFAKGEITKEQYKEYKRILQSNDETTKKNTDVLS